MCGITSRRNAEKLILEGRVKINGKTINDLGTKIDENNDTVSIDNKNIEAVKNFTYIMLNKPKGCVCSLNDEKGRKTIFNYLGDLKNKRLFPVGRLDYDTEGLIIVTNDGELSYKLTHPSNEIPKTYIVKVEGKVEESELAKLRKGIFLDGMKLHNCKIKLIEFLNNISRYEITIYEGRNREIHRMFESIGKEIIFLKRVAVGEMRLGGLSRGTYRYLTDGEIEYLKRY